MLRVAPLYDEASSWQGKYATFAEAWTDGGTQRSNVIGQEKAVSK